jgi:hypothetical protein
MLGNPNFNEDEKGKYQKSDGIWTRIGQVLILNSLDAPINLLAIEKGWKNSQYVRGFFTFYWFV